METPTLTYRSWIKIKLADSMAANAAYSLRAMARDLDVSASLLSDVMKGKKNFSFDRALNIAKVLKLNSRDTEIFVTLVQIELTKSDEMKAVLLQKLEMLQGRSAARSLDLDLFKTISDWYHLAILELTNVAGFSFTPLEISKSLGITRAEADAAVERLERLELLEKTKDRYKKTANHLLASSTIPNGALRKYHQQMLAIGSQALVDQAPNERFVGSETFAFDETQLKMVEEAFEDCFSKVIKIAASGKSKKSIYHCGIQFFRITKKKETKK